MWKLVSVLCWAYVLLVAGCSRGAGTVDELRSVDFRVVAESDGTPLQNREMQVFDGRFEDVVFEFTKTKVNGRERYLGTVVTDTNGCFALDLSDPKVPEEIVIRPGPPYDIIRIQRASFNKRSPLHIRVVRFVKGSRRVERNDIYDLKERTVKQIALDGKETGSTFQEVLLVAQSDRSSKTPH